jgi:hypothetical protein
MLTGWMLYTMWAVLGVIGLDFLAGLLRAIMSHSFTLSSFNTILEGMVPYVLPLLILAKLTSIDPTGWLVMIAYYVGGIGVIWKYLMDLRSKF